MSDPDRPRAADELAPNPPTSPAGDDAREPIEDRAAMRAMHLERARKLSRRLRVQVEIDEIGWLRSEIELVFRKGRDGTLRPVMVRVGRDVSDGAILAPDGVMVGCAQYNAALVKLLQLAEHLAALVRQGGVRLEPGSPVAYAHRQLSRCDEMIALRQVIAMGHGTVRLATLRREIEFFGRCDAHLAPIVQAAEDATNARTPRDPSRWRKLWRWLCWWRARSTASQRLRGASDPSPWRTT